MVKLPTREDLGPLPSARTGRAIARIQPAVADTTVAARGQRAIAEGITNLGRSFGGIAANFEREKEKDDTLAVIKAKAKRDLSMIELDRSLADGDFATYDQRFLEGAQSINEQFNVALPDDDLRARWGPEIEVDTERNRGAVLNRAKQLKDEKDFSDFNESMGAHRSILLSDTATPEQKAEAKKSIIMGIEARSEERRVGKECRSRW